MPTSKILWFEMSHPHFTHTVSVLLETWPRQQQGAPHTA